MNDIELASLWQYASIPVIAALIGWSTNWLAIQLTFYPLEFRGLRPWLGWQGIIPSKAGKMADIAVDSTISKLGTVQEIFEQIDPDTLASYIAEQHQLRAVEYVDEMMLAEHPVLWENLPARARQLLYDRVRQSMPRLVRQLVEDITTHIDDLFDLKRMVRQKLVENPELLNRLFRECGHQEFRFIIHSGFWLGLLFGLLQTAVWMVWSEGWVLPVSGLLVGLGTNWVALNVIFRPLYPTKIGPLTVQGLFLKRQKEVAGTFCRIVTQEILTIENIVDEMLTGPGSERTRALIQRNVKPIVDETTGVIKPLTQAVIGPERYAAMRQKAGDKAISVSSATFRNPMFNRERGARVEAIMRERMEALSPEAFQNLLRPCFQEDELKLVLIGGGLGFLAGLAQLVWIFGGSLLTTVL